MNSQRNKILSICHIRADPSTAAHAPRRGCHHRSFPDSSGRDGACRTVRPSTMAPTTSKPTTVAPTPLATAVPTGMIGSSLASPPLPFPPPLVPSPQPPLPLHAPPTGPWSQVLSLVAGWILEVDVVRTMEQILFSTGMVFPILPRVRPSVKNSRIVGISYSDGVRLLGAESMQLVQCRMAVLHV
jgi:hypothetical protein